MKYLLMNFLFIFSMFVSIAHAVEATNASSSTSSSNMISHFRHDDHIEKVFKPLQVDCTHCHNFTKDEANHSFSLNDKTKDTIFKMPLKQICHECHQSQAPQYEKAPKACFTCHQNMEGLRKIKPASHENISWKSTHSLEARVQGESCMNCHMTSQCSQCHLHRNSVEMKNHPRNFRFFHSVQARGQPQRCDACHAKTYCTNCHLGKN